MRHNWEALLTRLVQNRCGIDLEGLPGEWDSALQQLIAESYSQVMDDGDRSVLVVLLVLHEAIQGKISLANLVKVCQSSVTSQNLRPIPPTIIGRDQDILTVLAVLRQGIMGSVDLEHLAQICIAFSVRIAINKGDRIILV